ncbi:competence protein ComK [Oceanobacillus caeni]|uniref:competence protein ComK n=1 Tax=Oceanobacillus caeni TaxID=405946 RepID=UPI0019578FBF
MVMVKSPYYTVTKDTKMIVEEDSAYYRSSIIEENQTMKDEKSYSPYKPEQIIDYNCKRYGSTLNGRREVVEEILKSSSKIPIPINPQSGIYFIPTASTRNKNCVWIAYHQIKHYRKSDEQTLVLFHDGTSELIPTTVSVFDRQFKRASQVIVHFNRYTLFGHGPKLW